MSSKRKFEEQLATLDELRALTPEAAAPALRKALQHKNNFVVAKAAGMVRELALMALIPDLLTAFEHFLDDAAKTDPQCWAKNAISRALAEFEHPDAAVFLRGMRHIQNEPVWGGQSDTAATLRGTCAHALVQCRSVAEPELLRLLLELLGDKEKPVRVEAARAIEEVNSAGAALLLRLRAVLESNQPKSNARDEAEVVGACFGGVLRIEGKSAIPWISRFLADGDDIAGEAALAIASDLSPEAFEVLRDRFTGDRLLDNWFASVLLSAIALTRQQAALDFLLDLVREESMHAEAVIEVVLRSYPSEEVVAQLEKLVAGNPRLKRALAAQRK